MTPFWTISPILGGHCAARKGPLNAYEHTDHECTVYTAPLMATVNIMIVIPSPSPETSGRTTRRMGSLLLKTKCLELLTFDCTNGLDRA